MKVVFLDFETNGFKGSSVLSMSLRVDGDIINRYYYPREEYNKYAIEVNGLNEEKITKLRADVAYAKYFTDDLEVIDMFKDIEVLVAHNIDFDFSFLPDAIKSQDMKIFCTMKSNAYKFGKNTSLSDTARYYGIAVEEENLHNSDYDTYLCEKIFNAMDEKDKVFVNK